ncbi:Hypothetical predicted protein [Mytilus galloprovincialis]|uniref:Uncharacterized protein n=1 Tax=Mytilus galloprovincialis TaxID=29158 RepID=A0A8B6DUE1_MYTGA|nr:Hypothetical predicted protein [Mytilus galloprovincialis]
MKIHAKCTVSKLEVVAQGVKLTPKFTDIEKRIHNLSKYMNDLLLDVEKEIMLISDESSSFPKAIEDSKKDLMHMVETFEEEVLPNIERHRNRMQSFHNKLSILNVSVKKKEKEILHTSDRELILSLPKIEKDLQRFENQLLLNLREKEIEVIEPIVKLRPLRVGELNFQISYELRECPSRELSLIQEPFSLNKLQRVKDIQVDESFVFEIPTGNKATNITGCTIMLDGIMCFVDSKCSRFILRTADGIFKSFELPSVPLDITAVSKSEVAILHRTSISVLRVNEMQINLYKFKPTGKFRLIAFHKQNLIVCVGMCSFFIFNLQGQKIKEINIEESLISCISCWNNKIFYANRDKNNIYSVDLHSGESALVIHVGGIVNSPSCIVSDDSGKFFIAGADNNNIVAISIYQNEYKEVVQSLRSIKYPKTMSYDSTQRQLLICSPIGHSAVYSIH